MNDITTVGIIGGYGLTGQVVAEELTKQDTIRVLIGGRNIKKSTELVEILGNKTKPYQLDITNKEELDLFCSLCDIVINCTGPSVIYSEQVALAALKNHCHYVDPGGYEYLASKLMGYQKEIKDKNLYFILSCGWIPGISEVFVHYAHEQALRCMDSIDELDHFYGDRNEWSENGLKDMLWHVYCLNGSGSYFNGDWKPIKPFESFYKKIMLPVPFGKQKAIYNFANELKEFAENSQYKRISSYSILLSLRTVFNMMMIRAFYKKNEAKALEILKKAFLKDRIKNGKGSGVVVKIRGKKLGAEQVLIGSFFNESRHYWLTGIASVIVTKMIIGKKSMKSTGCGYLCDAVDATVFMDLLGKEGLEYRFVLNNVQIIKGGTND